MGAVPPPSAYFARDRVSTITVEEVDRYRTGKLREREDWLVERTLSNRSINVTLNVLAAVLDDAVEYGHLTTNPARPASTPARRGVASRFARFSRPEYAVTPRPLPQQP